MKKDLGSILGTGGYLMTLDDRIKKLSSILCPIPYNKIGSLGMLINGHPCDSTFQMGRCQPLEQTSAVVSDQTEL